MMVPGHPSHSALGAFHPTPIASSRISPTRQSGAVGAKERECNVGHYVEADDEEEGLDISLHDERGYIL